MTSPFTPDKGHTEVILFSRYPESGTSKTRLIPLLGSDNAARLQRLMTEKLLAAVEALSPGLGCRLTICFSGGTRAKMVTWLGEHRYVEQRGDDLGGRMQHAFSESFKSGAQQAILVGSDIPSIDTTLLAQAITLVKQQEVVIGPTYDGGYYLIGFNNKSATELYSAIFQGITWSTTSVFERTRQGLLALGITPVSLPKHHDIDVPEDLPYAEKWQLL